MTRPLNRSLVYAPDGDSIYYTRSEGTDTSIWRIGALGGQPRKVLNQARHPAISPDGRQHRVVYA